MTHPLTPREKVAEIVDPLVFELAAALDNAEGEPAALRRDATEMRDMRMREALSKADAILTALASGSGDHAELARLKAAMSKSNDEICQSLGKALGYPWFKDDQRNFPGATEGNGVCVGDHVAESIADEAASRISAILAENAALRAERDEWRDTAFKARSSNTRAERKLAEAVGLLRDSLAPGSFEGEAEISTRVRTFLSKEAERG
ncbi:hypothetical protein [Brevundimonas diminuta]|uniref:hypothetical protein n=1 Tax=Brevundimonas diminuta TaxID=293 RepID=UPI003D9A51C7